MNLKGSSCTAIFRLILLLFVGFVAAVACLPNDRTVSSHEEDQGAGHQATSGGPTTGSQNESEGSTSDSGPKPTAKGGRGSTPIYKAPAGPPAEGTYFYKDTLREDGKAEQVSEGQLQIERVEKSDGQVEQFNNRSFRFREPWISSTWVHRWSSEGVLRPFQVFANEEGNSGREAPCFYTSPILIIQFPLSLGLEWSTSAKCGQQKPRQYTYDVRAERIETLQVAGDRVETILLTLDINEGSANGTTKWNQNYWYSPVHRLMVKVRTKTDGPDWYRGELIEELKSTKPS